MPDIIHLFPVNASPAKVYDTVSSPEGLDQWWTLKSEGRPSRNADYHLYFSEAYSWRAIVAEAKAPNCFELKLTQAEDDWLGSRVRFDIEPKDNMSLVSFRHIGWREENEHFRTSCYCWAMYLRIMKRYIEFGEQVEYGKRLDA